MKLPKRRKIPREVFTNILPSVPDRLAAGSTNEVLYSSARQITAAQVRGPAGLTGTTTVYIRNGTDTSGPIVWELIAAANELNGSALAVPVDCPNGVFVERDGDATVTIHSQDGE